MLVFRTTPKAAASRSDERNIGGGRTIKKMKVKEKHFDWPVTIFLISLVEDFLKENERTIS
jgi:hypothetical protein